MGLSVFVAHPRRVDGFKISAVKYRRGRPDDHAMRCAKAEYAMCALGMLGIVDRQFRHIVEIVPAKLDGRRTARGTPRKRKTAEHD